MNTDVDNQLIGELQPHVRNLAKGLPDTKKFYFKRTLFLINACRYLMDHSKARTIAVHQLQEKIKKIDEVLGDARKLSDRDEVDPHFDGKLNKVGKMIEDFLKSEKLKPLSPSFASAIEDDKKTTSTLRSVINAVKKRVLTFQTTKVEIQIWPSKLYEVEPNNLKFASLREIQLKIETKVTLNVALCRLLSFYSVNLALDPQFYDKFPPEKGDFKEDKIKSQSLQGKVGEVVKKLKISRLHLVMDRTENIDVGQEFQNPDGKKLEYKNIWKLDKTHFVAKEYISGTLLLLPPSSSSKRRTLRQRVVGWVKGA